MVPIHPSTIATAVPPPAPHPASNNNATTNARADISMPDVSPTSKKRKRKQSPHILHSSTLRAPSWSYFHLTLALNSSLPPKPLSDQSSDQPASLDSLTVLPLLTTPLTTYLGLTGSSIPIDMLAISGLDVWIRIPREDGKAFRAALSSWSGSVGMDMVPGCEGIGIGDKHGRIRCSWRVRGEGQGLGLLMGGRDDDIFGG
ncbi:hypothetical protein P280DRAFT_469458 [Massarina eburnea CBS 473.64]|uniref:Ribonucleases P/MRP subunit Pop8-like domain-containing protein n=1 Tax=Massarina eburnea CBS 473.64 TaxID=1395130 RepID=A0A6A6S245_9PLEO|nr:hypothetical protein P280DRAFT_469458 [Massarina eburnea CBS 473.64]